MELTVEDPWNLKGCPVCFPGNQRGSADEMGRQLTPVWDPIVPNLPINYHPEGDISHPGVSWCKGGSLGAPVGFTRMLRQVERVTGR